MIGHMLHHFEPQITLGQHFRQPQDAVVGVLVKLESSRYVETTQGIDVEK